MSSPSPIDPGRFAQLVAEVSDADLEAGLRTNGAFILEQVFAQMPAHLDAARARDAEFVIEWRIRRAEQDAVDMWQVRVSGGRAEVERDGTAEPTAVLTVGAVDFIRVVTGNADPAQLYLTGRVAVEGDLMTATMMRSYFRFPDA